MQIDCVQYVKHRTTLHFRNCNRDVVWLEANTVRDTFSFTSKLNGLNSYYPCMCLTVGLSLTLLIKLTISNLSNHFFYILLKLQKTSNAVKPLTVNQHTRSL